MLKLNKKSLAASIDSLNDAHFHGLKIPKMEKVKFASWIAGRAGMERMSYASMPAPTEPDFEQGVKLFTGEKVTSGAATGHILGEEACRALIQLGVKTPDVKNALKIGTEGILARLDEEVLYKRKSRGMYCCGTCSVSYWRHLIAGGLDDQEARIVNGMKDLKRHRIGDGRWKRFPFYYTLLALDEIELPGAVREMKYAAPVLERVLKRKGRDDKYDKRRRALAERILSKC